MAKKIQSKRVYFSISAPHAVRVAVVGDFNGWNPEANVMKMDKKGFWKTALSLPRGRSEYKFVVDGSWETDPANPLICQNAFGTANSVLEV